MAWGVVISEDFGVMELVIFFRGFLSGRNKTC